MKKLKECRDYVKNYPTMASGYINLAAVYADLGDFVKSDETLVLGEKHAKTNDEKYLIDFNRAICAFNQQQYDKALSFANSAKEIRDDDNVREMIDEIKQLTGK